MGAIAPWNQALSVPGAIALKLRQNAVAKPRIIRCGEFLEMRSPDFLDAALHRIQESFVGIYHLAATLRWLTDCDEIGAVFHRVGQHLHAFLQPPAGCNVALDGHEMGDGSCTVLHRGDGHFFVVESPILMPIYEFALPNISRFDGLP